MFIRIFIWDLGIWVSGYLCNSHAACWAMALVISFLAVLMCLWWQRGMHWQLSSAPAQGTIIRQARLHWVGMPCFFLITFSLYCQHKVFNHLGLEPTASSSSASSPSPSDGSSPLLLLPPSLPELELAEEPGEYSSSEAAAGAATPTALLALKAPFAPAHNTWWEKLTATTAA